MDSQLVLGGGSLSVCEVHDSARGIHNMQNIRRDDGSHEGSRYWVGLGTTVY